MNAISLRTICLLFSSALCLLSIGQSEAKDNELVGMWEGKRIAGPEIQGDIIITRESDRWRIDLSGYNLSIPLREGKLSTELSFSIPGGLGSFNGKLDPASHQVRGYWIQPSTINNGMPYASPVVLTPDNDNRWRGKIVPMPDEFSVFLPVWEREDGALGAFFRNPDRGFGVFYNVDRVERKGDSVRWLGRFFRDKKETVLVEAQYQPGRMSVDIRGNLYDLRLTPDDNHSHFYARGKNPEPYDYIPPPEIPGDGWSVSSLGAEKISEQVISNFIEQVILPAADSIDDPYIHGVLIARSGRLVLEEYFHGFHRNKAHDTRSASKSLASVLVGAAIHNGIDLELGDPVFVQKVLAKEAEGVVGVDPRRQRITLEHLLTMSSGLDCDDSDASSKGNEDTMQSQQEQTDWYRYMAHLDMVREPGEKAVYCSGGINLVGAVLSAASGRSIEELFFDFIAKPLQIDHYYLNLSPTGQPYLGGGIYWKPRDFMKLGQLMLNKGIWNGQRIISEEFAENSISTKYKMANRGYGYAWWITRYPYKNRQVEAFFAGGNGGQIVMGIPDLDLLVAFYAGNYSHKTFRKIQQEFVPQYILPALN
ncbi:serine hydrolase domain-containing protein [Microbulbifer sp. 2201CG32-9]|uniref:serine hydrolase domain-containing protein n=1 Tax=Microbulbifer sp. 2201CG32-9 TaxID=3232309 RepID=UPI00345B845D